MSLRNFATLEELSNQSGISTSIIENHIGLYALDILHPRDVLHSPRRKARVDVALFDAIVPDIRCISRHHVLSVSLLTEADLVYHLGDRKVYSMREVEPHLLMPL